MTTLPLSVAPAAVRPAAASPRHLAAACPPRPLSFTRRMHLPAHPLPLALTRTYGPTGLAAAVAAILRTGHGRDEATRHAMEQDALRLHRRGYRITDSSVQQTSAGAVYRVSFERG